MPIITKMKNRSILRTLLFAAALLTAAAAMVVAVGMDSSTMTHAQEIARSIILNAAKVITEHWPPYTGRFA